METNGNYAMKLFSEHVTKRTLKGAGVTDIVSNSNENIEIIVLVQLERIQITCMLARYVKMNLLIVVTEFNRAHLKLTTTNFITSCRDK